MSNALLANAPRLEVSGGRATAVGAAGETQHFLEYISGYRKCSQATVVAYGHDLQDFLAWAKANHSSLDLHDIDEPMLMRYLARNSRLSANTLRRRIHCLSSFLEFALRQGLVTRNVARHLPLPQRDRRLPRYPGTEQIRDIVAACRTPLEKAAIWLLVTTGVRRAELLGLDLDDLDLDSGQIKVLGKGNRGRWVPLPEATVEVLCSYLQGRGMTPGPLLLNRAGQRLGPTSLRRLIQRVMRRAGLEDEQFSTHSFRHAYCTSLIRSGADIAVVRDLAGHGDISVTGRYVHSDGLSRRVAVEQLPVLTMGGGDGE
jgi:site-specific recombinase XerD